MSISKDEVRHVAGLAQLSLSDAEVAAMQDHLNAILGYVDRLDRFDLASVTPDELTPIATPIQADRPVPGLSPGEATTTAPVSENELFKVPPAIRGGTKG